MPPIPLLTPEETKLLHAPDLEPVKKFVSGAFQKKENGDPFHYRHIVSQLRSRDDPETLWKVLLALTQQVSTFTSRPDQYKDIISSIFHYSWNMAWKIRIALINLVHHIVSANSIFLLPALQLLVKSFMWMDTATTTNTVSSPTTTPSESSEPNESLLSSGIFNSFLCKPNNLHSLLHRAIRCLLSICPSGQSELFPILESNFPFKKNSAAEHRSYVVHLLVICQYLPVQQTRILELILVKCIEIDVEIHIEESGEVKIQAKQNEYDDPDQVMFGNTDTQNGTSTGMNSTYNNGVSNLNEVSEYAQKLDDMLLLVIQYFDGKLAEQQADGGGKDRLFLQILQIFEQHLLMVHKSKFVQFLLFYLASKDHKFAQLFPRLLLNIFFDERHSFLKRQSAVVYLSSYLGRANFVPFHFIGSVVQELLRWCYTYALTSSGLLGVLVLPRFITPIPPIPSSTMQGDDSGGATASVLTGNSFATEYDAFGRLVPRDLTTLALAEKHSTFLCCVQALCYMLCFFGTELAASQREQPQRTQWEAVLTCSLTPLRHCAPSIRTEVTRLIRAESLIADDLMEHLPVSAPSDPTSTAPAAMVVGGGGHNRQDLTAFYRVSSSSAGAVASSKHAPLLSVLESFFPFDPCLLAGLCHSVEAHYREWRGIPGIDVPAEGADEDATNSEDETETEDEDEAQDSIASSMVSMSICSNSEHRTRAGSSLAASSNSDASYWGPAASSSSAMQHEAVLDGTETASLSGVGRGSDWKANNLRPRQYSVGSTGDW